MPTRDSLSIAFGTLLLMSIFFGCDASNLNGVKMNGVPTEEDWRSEPWGVDIPSAYDHFFGKSREDATKLFVESSLYYQEDVMFMPQRCFSYYVHSYIDYLTANDSMGDCDGANCFFSLVKFRASDISKLDPQARLRIVKLLEHLGENQQWYGADEEIYGDFATLAMVSIKRIK